MAALDKAQSRYRDILSLCAGIFFLLLAWAGSAFSVRSADAEKTGDWNRSSLLYLPSEKLLKPMALDFDEAAADLIWVDGVLYFSESYFSIGIKPV